MNNSRFKFRVWDKERKYMHYMPAAELYEKLFLRADGVLCNVGYSDRRPVDGKYEISFSTGLYDCEGREVFEGDVCEYSYVDWRSNKFEGLCLIFWNDFLFKFDSMTIKDPHNDMHSELPLCRNVSSLTLKIIGNRFENPELLEAQK